MDHPNLFDRSLIAQRRKRALKAAVPGADFLITRVVDDLSDRLDAVKRTFATASAIGDPTARTARMLADKTTINRVVRTSPVFSPETDCVVDAEFLPFAPASLDLVVCVLSLQAVNDLPGALVQIRRALAPDGLLLAALAGGETLTELRQSLLAAEIELTGGASPRVAPAIDVRDMGALLQRAGFALPVSDVDRVVVRYDSPFGLMKDLRAMGATNALADRSRRPVSRRFFLRAAEIYLDRFADADGRIRATFDIVSASGWAPHESQQKPARPGSAKMRLADALGTTELGAGEQTGREIKSTPDPGEP